MTNPVALVSPICCSSRQRRVDINAGSSVLTFMFCGRCERTRWLSDGRPVTQEAIQRIARAMPVKGRLTRAAS
jgi:hypothetical protein